MLVQIADMVVGADRIRVQIGRGRRVGAGYTERMRVMQIRVQMAGSSRRVLRVLMVEALRRAMRLRSEKDARSKRLKKKQPTKLQNTSSGLDRFIFQIITFL